MMASLQILCENGNVKSGVIRIHPVGGKWEDRSGYDWSCSIKITGTQAELLGVDRLPTLAQARSIRDRLREEGLTATFERNGRTVFRT